MRFALGKLAPLLALVLGCGLFGSGEDKPVPMKFQLDAAARLNPDEHGRALPTVVRIYQLKSAAKMEMAGFDDLFKREKEVLGEDMVKLDEIEVAPGERIGRILQREKEVRYVAVVALFRRPAGSSWRAILELPKPNRNTDLKFWLEDYRVVAK
jgi:type VI secretion system protein VasD